MIERCLCLSCTTLHIMMTCCFLSGIVSCDTNSLGNRCLPYQDGSQHFAFSTETLRTAILVPRHIISNTSRSPSMLVITITCCCQSKDINWNKKCFSTSLHTIPWWFTALCILYTILTFGWIAHSKNSKQLVSLSIDVVCKLPCTWKITSFISVSYTHLTLPTICSV